MRRGIDSDPETRAARRAAREQARRARAGEAAPPPPAAAARPPRARLGGGARARVGALLTRGRVPLAAPALVLLLGLTAALALAVVDRRANPFYGVFSGLFAAESRAQAPAPPRPTAARFDAARRYAATRRGTIAFSVVDSAGRQLGHRSTRGYWSASVVKPMIMVAYLNRVGARPLTNWERAQLGPMIRRSENDPATRLFRIVGTGGLRRVAQRAGMTRFVPSPAWGSSQITAGDQARFFLKIDALVPAPHRRYVRTLLGSIVERHRWGIPRAAAPRYRVLFKGGWRKGMRGGQIAHQVARLEDGTTRFSIAILTDDAPSQSYGRETVGGIAARLAR